jgi:Protein of unknown function (DUF3533)
VADGPDEDGGDLQARVGLKAKRHVVAALCVALLVQVLFVLSYVGALHSPKPHRVALGVVGSPVLSATVGKQFSLRAVPYSSDAAALHAINERKIVGALVDSKAGAKLYVVPAAGPAMASALGAAFGAAAVAFHKPIEVVQVHPLPKRDATGIVSFLVTMALVVGGYLAATMLMAFGGSMTQKARAGVLAGAAVVGALLTDTVAGPILGAIPGSKFLVLWGLFILVMAAVTLATSGLQARLGPPGTLVVVVVFVIFGAPAAGGAVPAPFLPGFWRTIGPYLPAGAGTTAVRNTLYFGGNATGRALVVLAAYLVIGAVVTVTAGKRPPATSQNATGEAEAAAAAAAAAAV